MRILLILFICVMVGCRHKTNNVDAKNLKQENEPTFGKVKFPDIEVLSYETEDPVRVGENTKYIFSFKNTGNGVATQEFLEIKIPNNCIIVSQEAIFKIQGQTKKIKAVYNQPKAKLIFEKVTLPPNEVVTYSIEVKANKVGEESCKIMWSIEELPKLNIHEEETSFYK